LAQVRHRKDIFDAIRSVLLEHGTEQKLNYSALYHKVSDRLKETKQKGISRRDFDSEIKLAVQEKKLIRTENKDSKSKVKPVYFSLTENALKQYHQDFLGINEVKDRRRKLFQLLLIYEVSKGSRAYISGDKDFDKFLKSFSLSRQNLKIATRRTSSNSDKTVITFHPLNGLSVTKYQKHDRKGIGKKPRCILGARGRTQYSVDLPGFTIEEIFQYAEEQTMIHMGLPFHPSTIFSDVQLSVEEIRATFDIFEKSQLIKPFSINNPDDIEPILLRKLKGRYFIADKRLQALGQSVWDLYNEKLNVLQIKYIARSFDDKDRSWLRYIVGEWPAATLMQEWEDFQDFQSTHTYDEEGIEIMDKRRETLSSFDRVREIEFNAKIDELIKKYRPVLEEYGLPLSYIRTMLSIS
jgi:hypothetical protein